MRALMMATTIAAVGLAGAAQAAPLEGRFVLVGSSAQGSFDGVEFVETSPFDIYEFQVTNNTGQNLFTFQNLVFQGDFLQGASSAKLGAELAADPFDGFIPGTQLTPDTFFTDDNAAPSSPSGIVDTASELSSVSVGILGQPWIVDGATEAIALFSVPAGTPVGLDTFVSGGGTTGSVLTPITVIPEPASMALLGLGGLALLRRKA